MQIDLSDSSLFNHKSVMTDEILVSINQYPLISGNKLTGIDATSVSYTHLTLPTKLAV